jgi:hypothetical protein
MLRLDDLRRLLDAAPEVRRVELSNYGEIFLNPELPGILRLCHERRVATSAFNGVNLNSARPDALEGVVRWRMRAMTVSIDGATQESYQRYRVRGRLDRVLANIATINAHKRDAGSDLPRLRWQCVVFGHNEHEIGAARTMAASLGMAFAPKLSWTDSFSRICDSDAVRRAMPNGAATRAEFFAATGRDYLGGICNQLWDSPQVNWDGKLLGCRSNFWGDFGANVFNVGFEAAVNGERITHAHAMLQGSAETRADIPCTICDSFTGMRESGRFLPRDEAARGKPVAPDEAVAAAAYWRDAGWPDQAAEACRRVLAEVPSHAGARALLAAIEGGG